MPTYCYEDPQDKQVTSIFMTIAEMEKRSASDMSIELDGVHLIRRLDMEISGSVGGTCASWPMKSDSCGVHPSDTGSASEASVKMGVPTRFDKETGQAIFESRGHRAKYLKARGFHDRNGGYGDG
tara:strand:+ start:710 stop:1084 length:375 start_codon:yes stop_codon:yes gene_type:complete